MAKKARLRKHFVKEIEFKIKEGKSLIVSMGMPILGIDRIIVENNKGIVDIKAEGRSRFEFSNQKIHFGACDFWLANPPGTVLLHDYLYSCFWSQFNWGELFRYKKNKILEKELKKEIRKLVREFESKTSKRLNEVFGIIKNSKSYKILKNGQVVESQVPGKFAGHKPRKIFGRLNCKSGMKIKKENRVFFLTYEDAINEGYRPCKKCKPAN